MLKIHNYVETESNERVFVGDKVRVHFKDECYKDLDVCGVVESISYSRRGFTVKLPSGLSMACRLSQVKDIEKVG